MGTLRGCGALQPYMRKGTLYAACPSCSAGELAQAPWILGTWEEVQERALVRALDRDARLSPDEALVAILVRRALSVPPCGKAGPLEASAFRRVQVEVQERVEHVAPLIPAREALETETPRAVKALVKLLTAKGYRVLVHYALGTRASLIHSVCLRARREGRGLVGVWTVAPVAGVEHVPEAGWKFDMAYVWDVDRPAAKVNATALKAFIQEG